MTSTARQSPRHSVLLVEPWFAGSHRAWAEGLAAHSRHSIELLTHRPAGWRDTFDYSAGRLASGVRHRPDAVLASSMMDLGAFLDGSGLHEVPTILYLHENQLTYDRDRPDLTRGAVNWVSARRANEVVFNSRFHRDDFHDALSLLGIPARVADAHRSACRVVPVGIEVPGFSGPEIRTDGPPAIAWNHRWEADKDPGALLDALEEIADLDFHLILLGEQAATSRHRNWVDRRFGDRLLHIGHAPRPTYVGLLRRADVVVSTARQEFFGVAIVEALAAGAVPIVPDRLAYPEVLGDELAECRYEPNRLAATLRSLLADRPRIERLRPVARRAAMRFDWAAVIGRYDDLIDSIV